MLVTAHPYWLLGHCSGTVGIHPTGVLSCSSLPFTLHVLIRNNDADSQLLISKLAMVTLREQCEPLNSG